MVTKQTKIIVASVVALLVVSIGFLAIVQMNQNKLTATDYKQAQSSIDKLKKAYDQLDASYASYSGGDPATTDDLQAKLNTYKTAVTQIESSKAILEDSSITQKYTAFKAKNDQYVNYISGYVKDKKTLASLMSDECYKSLLAFPALNKNMVIVIDSAHKNCLATITALQQSSNAGFAAYGASLNAYYNERRAEYSQLVKAINGDATVDVKATLKKISETIPPESTKLLDEARSKASARKALEALANQTTVRAVEVTTVKK